MVAVRALAERDLPEAQRIIHRAFGTFLGVPDLEKFCRPLHHRLCQTRPIHLDHADGQAC